MQTPTLEHVEQVSDGWVKKYILTYRMPDGSLHPYEMASRKNEPQLRALFERNALACQRAIDGKAGGGTTIEDYADAARTPSSTPDAVCIVARTPRKTLVMEREFRYPLNSWCIALPAGLVDPGEDILTCAARELSEETGYEVIDGAPTRILPQPGYSSTGLTDETVHVVFVEAEKAGAAHTEQSELIEVFELPLADIDRFLETNRLPMGTRAQLILEIMKSFA